MSKTQWKTFNSAFYAKNYTKTSAKVCSKVALCPGGAFTGPAGVRIELRGVRARVHGVRRRDGGASAADRGAPRGPPRRAAEGAGRGREKRAGALHAYATYLIQGIPLPKQRSSSQH